MSYIDPIDQVIQSLNSIKVTTSKATQEVYALRSSRTRLYLAATVLLDALRTAAPEWSPANENELEAFRLIELAKLGKFE